MIRFFIAIRFMVNIFCGSLPFIPNDAWTGRETQLIWNNFSRLSFQIMVKKF
jgi:hypothetical protein